MQSLAERPILAFCYRSERGTFAFLRLHVFHRSVPLCSFIWPFRCRIESNPEVFFHWPGKQPRYDVVVGVIWTPTYLALHSPVTNHPFSICSVIQPWSQLPGGPGASGQVPAA